MNKKYDLSERLEDFAAEVIKNYDKSNLSYASDYLTKQLIRSACSSALNFGESLGAGSAKDKINKLRITLKELRECMRNFNIQSKADLFDKTNIEKLREENDQLIRIVVTMIKNLNKE